jgi:phage shock protein A
MNAKGYEEYLLLRRSVEALVSEHEKLRELATDLKNELSEVKRQLAEKNEEVKELQTRYERAKFSGAVLGSGDDAAKARKRVSELVREIDKCIALLDR